MGSVLDLAGRRAKLLHTLRMSSQAPQATLSLTRLWHFICSSAQQEVVPHLSRSLGSLERHSSTLCARSSLAASSSTQSRRSLHYMDIAHQHTRGG